MDLSEMRAPVRSLGAQPKALAYGALDHVHRGEKIVGIVDFDEGGVFLIANPSARSLDRHRLVAGAVDDRYRRAHMGPLALAARFFVEGEMEASGLSCGIMCVHRPVSSPRLENARREHLRPAIFDIEGGAEQDERVDMLGMALGPASREPSPEARADEAPDGPAFALMLRVEVGEHRADRERCEARLVEIGQEKFDAIVCEDGPKVVSLLGIGTRAKAVKIGVMDARRVHELAQRYERVSVKSAASEGYAPHLARRRGGGSAEMARAVGDSRKLAMLPLWRLSKSKPVE